MGTWGEGNFENDGALDFVGGLIDELVEKINECFADEDLAALDEDGEAVIVPGVHVISVLNEQCHAAPPKLDIIIGWRDKYLAIFDEQIGGLDPVKGFEQKRRAIIEATFSKLEEQSRRFWGES
ncbi:hypothetical protein IAD21_05720 [Abditibacteriota bacterium]|nr:hypothetical protein IAD21_05720 [Abditibacteriota bacterium]